eukprot:symbB.v1.2.018261.t1/scaffold1446.1/size211836/4
MAKKSKNAKSSSSTSTSPSRRREKKKKSRSRSRSRGRRAKSSSHSRHRKSRSRSRHRHSRSRRRSPPRPRSPPRRGPPRRGVLTAPALAARPQTPPRRRRSWSRASESSFDSGTASPKSLAVRDQPKMGILYWGAGLEGQGWDLLGRGPGGFPRIDRNSDALVDSWKGRMENAQVTLRMCASEGPGFKRYVKHFLMLSAQACIEFRLAQYHRYNTLNRRKVLTERIVIGGILDCYHRNIPSSGMHISNGVDDFIACLRRRARRYRAQAAKQGGHFAAVILEGGRSELRFAAAARAAEELGASKGSRAQVKRIMLILGGPNGISDSVRETMRKEKYTDFPLLGVALPGGILHSYYALATVLVFHDQGLLLPFLEQQLGTPRPAQSPPRRLQPQPPKQPPPKHLLEAAKAEDEEMEEIVVEEVNETSKTGTNALPAASAGDSGTLPKAPGPPFIPKTGTNALPAASAGDSGTLPKAPGPPFIPNTGTNALPAASAGDSGTLPKAPGPPFIPPPGPVPAAPVQVQNVSLAAATCKAPPNQVGLIWPLRPAAVYVPLLPDALVDFCGAPLPFVLGIASEMVKRAEAICEPHTLFVNVDTCEVKVTQEMRCLDVKMSESNLPTAIEFV